MIAPARRAAFDALVAVEAGSADLGSALAAARRHLRDPRDVALALELASGTLRRRGSIDYQLATRVKRPLTRLDRAVVSSLRLGAYQVLYLTRQPPAAVVNDAVNLVRAAGATSAAGLVNAVLRALVREREALSWPARPPTTGAAADRQTLVAWLAVVHSHPEWLVARWVDRWGPEAAERWLAFDNEPGPLCLAPNRTLVDRRALGAALDAEGVRTTPTGTAAHGLLALAGRPLETRAYREGLFVVQDEAAQVVVAELAPPPGSRVLDLCAAPGGKTVALAADVGPGGLVVACDVRQGRLGVLGATLARCRIANARPVQVPAAGALPFRDGSFDAVLVDAPCSGLGTLRRDPDIRWRRTEADLPAMAARQRALLGAAAPLVRRGGRLTYSTCSSEPEENQAVAGAFLAAHPAFRLVAERETLPFRDGLEAFYAATFEARCV